MYGCMDVWMYGYVDGWMDEWMSRWIGGWVDGWMDGWWPFRNLSIPTVSVLKKEQLSPSLSLCHRPE
jgi:hypothetical protein